MLHTIEYMNEVNDGDSGGDHDGDDNDGIFYDEVSVCVSQKSITSELSAGGAKWDAENTPKGTHLICILAPRSH